MASNPGQWWETPSGSRASALNDLWQHEEENQTYNDPSQAGDVFASYPGEVDEEMTAMMSSTYGASEVPHGALMTTKIPFAWNGTGSWFAYDELVLDWVDSTTLLDTQQGPALKNRLLGAAGVYKGHLDRE